MGKKAPDGKSMAHKLTTLELIGALMPLVMDFQAMAGQPVVCFLDNIGAAWCWKKGHSNKDELASTIVRAMAHVAAAARIELFVEWIPRNSTPDATLCDSLSKGSLRAALHYPDMMANLPSPPKVLMDWLKDPRVDDSLGPRLIREVAISQSIPWLSSFTK